MRADLGELEREVLHIVWRSGPASADQVRQALRRPLKESTIRTVLSRLEAKGYLAHGRAQRTFMYRAVKSPAHLAARAVQRVADWFCDGSVDAVLLGMVEAKVLSRRDLRRLVEKVEKGNTGEK
ncbi:MAG TPA: BlaI/MecI/CopY family transcriptional regulator [Steroidobacteraceae bacterium]|jgi:predicted transcriptional regulator|nr:BlaI/MecI/CopY family transcriptional regulator [Steroidobacteraceae bacterium]